MEPRCCPESNESPLELADRKSLFQLLSFLDSQPPQYYGVYTLVRTALLIDNLSEYRVYFRRLLIHSTSTRHEYDYSVIIGAQMVPFEGLNQQPIRKCWILTAWILDSEQLPEAYSAIEDINWSCDVSFIHGLSYTPHPAIERFFNSKHGPGTETLSPVLFDRFTLPIKDALNIQISCPDNVYVKSLESCHAQLIYDHWMYKHFSSVENIAQGTNQLPSAGVFLKENNELISWVMCFPLGGMSRLHTLENHRRRGYAKLAVQYLSKRMAQSGFFPFVHILVDNKVSLNLFQSLGFKLGCSCHYFQIQPNSTLLQN